MAFVMRVSASTWLERCVNVLQPTVRRTDVLPVARTPRADSVRSLL